MNHKPKCMPGQAHHWHIDSSVSYERKRRIKCIKGQAHHWLISPEIKDGFSAARCLKCGADKQMTASWEIISGIQKLRIYNKNYQSR